MDLISLNPFEFECVNVGAVSVIVVFCQLDILVNSNCVITSFIIQNIYPP